MQKHTIRLCAVSLVALALGNPRSEATAGAPSPQDPAVDMNMVKLLFGMEPPAKRAPVRSTPARVALGRELYHETRLSRDGDVSCATCHDLGNFGQDGKKTSPGTGGAAGKRNTPTTFNAYRQFAQFWDYRAATAEDAVTAELLGPAIHSLKDEAELVSILASAPEYLDRFKRAFPKDDHPITAKNIHNSLGAFLRKLKTVSRWDKFVEGDAKALTADEKRGLQAFLATGCTTCHMTRLLGGSMPQKLGLIRPVESADKGRFEYSKRKGEEMLFKVPSLLNVAKTAPYHHDGSVGDLEEAVRLMVKHQVVIPASESQIKSIVAFLGALTGEPPGKPPGDSPKK